MSEIELVPLISRWLHVAGGATFVGSTIFMYLALRGPIASELSGEQSESFRSAVMNKWKHIVALLFVVVFGSGLYNYLAVTRFAHDGQGQYHMLFGIKFLVAFAAFVLVFIVTSTMSWSVKLRDNPVLWHLAVAAALTVVIIAGYMKMMPGP